MSPRAGGKDTRELARKEPDGANGRTVQTAADVRRVLGDQIAQLTANPDLDPARKAGLLAQLAPIALRAIEDATLEARIAAIEAVLQGRTDHPGSAGTQATAPRGLVVIERANPPRRDGTQATNAQTLAAHYSRFTPKERLRLLLAAKARGDEEEIKSLCDSIPDRTFAGPDLEYQHLVYTHWTHIREIILSWVDVSHLVIRGYFAFDICNVEMEFSLVERRRRRVRKVLTAVKAQWWGWTAAWKGIDSAITRFCGEAGFERDQLFALFKPLPAVIEQARICLAAEVLADSESEKSNYDLLRRVWPSQAALRPQP